MLDAWRSTIREIVAAFVGGDFAVSGVADVEPSTSRLAEQRRFAVASSGQTLAPITDDLKCAATRMDDGWNVIVELPTARTGGLTLVVELRITERAGGFRYIVGLIYVP